MEKYCTVGILPTSKGMGRKHKAPSSNQGVEEKEKEPLRTCGTFSTNTHSTKRRRSKRIANNAQLAYSSSKGPAEGGFRVPTVVKLYSAYMGQVSVNAISIGNGKVELETKHSGLDGKDITVKCIDGNVAKMDDKSFHTDDALMRAPATVIDIAQNKWYGTEIARLSIIKSKTARDTYMLNWYRNKVNGVDVHFVTYEYLTFIQTQLNFNNVVAGNTLYSIHSVNGLANAFFTGTYMLYGGGNGQDVGPMGCADVGGHELGHGLVSQTANLEYEGECGAMNEHIADVIGLCAEYFIYQIYNGNSDPNDDIKGESDWFMGEDSFSNKPLRNFMNPTLGLSPQPWFFQGQYWADTNNIAVDHGGVHFNSGPLNYNFYLMSQKIGMLNALKLEFKVLRDKLHSRSGFIHFRDSMLQCADDGQRPLVRECLDTIGLTSSARSNWRG